MTGSIWILVDHLRGKLAEGTLEALALGRELADAAGVPLEAVLLGSGVAGLAAELGLAQTVLSVEHTSLADPLPAVWAEALSQLAAARTPAVIIIPASNTTLGIAALAADRLNTAAVNFCGGAHLAGEAIECTASLYAGKMEVVAACAAPLIISLWPGARNPELGESPTPPEIVEHCSVELAADGGVRFLRYIEPEAGEVDITTQPVLVGVGRGIQSADNLELAEELAAALGGAVAGSRPVIDQGWLPLSRQVGKSGATVKPKLYIAAGISGAPEHVEGMRGAALIVAINSDPQAPIFRLAHYGVAADVLDILPALTEAVRAREGILNA